MVQKLLVSIHVEHYRGMSWPGVITNTSSDIQIPGTYRKNIKDRRRTYEKKLSGTPYRLWKRGPHLNMYTDVLYYSIYRMLRYFVKPFSRQFQIH
jgi:hypothetical protein